MSTGLFSSRPRSPKAPSMPLEDAVKLAAVLLERAGGSTRSPIPMEVVAEAWGNSVTSGSFMKKVATVVAFGLLEKQGAGLLRVSELAHRIIKGPAADRMRFLQEAALKPKAFRAVWEHYQGELPTDDKIIVFFLTGDHGYLEAKAKTVVRAFRQTVEFAEMHTAVSEVEGSPQSHSEDEEAKEDRSAAIDSRSFPQETGSSIRLKLSGGEVLSFEFESIRNEDAAELMALAMAAAARANLEET